MRRLRDGRVLQRCNAWRMRLRRGGLALRGNVRDHRRTLFERDEFAARNILDGAFL